MKRELDEKSLTGLGTPLLGRAGEGEPKASNIGYRPRGQGHGALAEPDNAPVREAFVLASFSQHENPRVCILMTAILLLLSTIGSAGFRPKAAVLVFPVGVWANPLALSWVGHSSGLWRQHFTLKLIGLAKRSI